MTLSTLQAKWLEKVARLWCHLFGCCLHEQVPECVRCGAHLYEGFCDYGKISGPWWRVRNWAWCQIHRVYRRCECCGKVMWFKPHEPTCSEECDEKWIPF